MSYGPSVPDLYRRTADYVDKILRRSARQDIASSSSSLRWPGTMATGMGKSPAFLARLETSGPGPSLLVAAASTRAAISSSSSIRLRTSCALSRQIY